MIHFLPFGIYIQIFGFRVREVKDVTLITGIDFTNNNPPYEGLLNECVIPGGRRDQSGPMDF